VPYRRPHHFPLIAYDPTIDCDDDGLTINDYRKPGDVKRIEYRSIQGYEIFEMGFWTGRHRVVGISFGRPRNCFPWDRDRKEKSTAISLDVGGWIRPTLVPDDPAAVAEILNGKTSAP
jgi:hypothetical protein